ncbi:hypothetical protein [Streptomyces sp. NBC_01092]|uniref:hypothetical protein n=1 Tax=Streptomyces sp. NBC_01092 TaxID=2903748 RepID=UPI00386F29B2|nr:hypothetical protein OG254_45700 [Streptomyces sp. NBC_01092]
MDDHRHEAPGGSADPVPRDPPDQQADAGEDPWEVPVKRTDEAVADDVPDTDEAGTGRRGAPRSGTVHPEHPTPQEPPA